MSADPRYGAVPISISRFDAPPVILTLRQIDGLYRVAFSCQAAEMAAAIERGQTEAHTFGLGLIEQLPVRKEADARAARFLIEMTLALSWAWISVSGVEEGDPDLWKGDRTSIALLIRNGDPSLGVPPLTGPLGLWFNGPLLEIIAEGEAYGPSRNGAGAAGPTIAKAAIN